MEQRVKATAIRVLSHSAQNLRQMHEVMQMELGDGYTDRDRSDLDRLVRQSLLELRQQIEQLD